MAAMESPSLMLMSFTPCVALPASLMSETFILMVSPDFVMIMRSLSSVTFLMAMRLPVLSVMFMVFTPFPPLFVIRYSSKSVLLPNPCSLTTRTLCAEASGAEGS